MISSLFSGRSNGVPYSQKEQAFYKDRETLGVCQFLAVLAVLFVHFEA